MIDPSLVPVAPLTLVDLINECDRHLHNSVMMLLDHADNVDGTSTDQFYIDMIQDSWWDMRMNLQKMLWTEYQLQDTIINQQQTKMQQLSQALEHSRRLCIHQIKSGTCEICGYTPPLTSTQV